MLYELKQHSVAVNVIVFECVEIISLHGNYLICGYIKMKALL